MEAAKSAEDALRDHLPGLRECVLAGVQFWFSLPPEIHIFARRRCRATIISDRMDFVAMQLFQNDPNVRMDTRGARLRLFIDRFQLRFKKLDQNLRCRYIPTQEALNFDHQVQSNVQLSLFNDLAAVTNLTVGYVWNSLETDARIFTVCPNGARNEWEIELRGEGPEGGISAPLPGPVGPQPVEPAKRVIPKSTQMKKPRPAAANG